MDKVTPLQVVLPSIQSLISKYGRHFISPKDNDNDNDPQPEPQPQPSRTKRRKRGRITWSKKKKSKAKSSAPEPQESRTINPNVSKHLLVPNARHSFLFKKRIVPSAKLPESTKTLPNSKSIMKPFPNLFNATKPATVPGINNASTNRGQCQPRTGVSEYWIQLRNLKKAKDANNAQNCVTEKILPIITKQEQDPKVPKIISIESLQKPSITSNYESISKPPEPVVVDVDMNLEDDPIQLQHADPLITESQVPSHSAYQPSLLALVEGLDPTDPNYFEDISSSETLTLNYVQPEVRDTLCYKCEHCPKTFTELKFFKLHSRIHETKIRKPYICLHTNCAERFESSMLLQRHRQTAHSRNIEILEVQTAVLKSVTESEISTKPPQPIPTLNQAAKTKTSIEKNKVVDDLDALERKDPNRNGYISFYGTGDQTESNPEEPVNCPTQEKDKEELTFLPNEEERSELSIVAVGTVEINRKHRCTLCGEEFEKLFDFLNHERTHNAEANFKSRVYECPHCPRLFSCEMNLGSHVRAHKGGNGYSLNRRRLRREENEIGHTRKPISCQYCLNESTFGKISCYVEHIKNVHPTSVNYQCPYCSRVIKHPWHFTTHIHAHEKGYRCKPCERDFSTKEQLMFHWKSNKHERDKEQIKKGKLFKAKIAKNTNIKTKKFSCEVCSKVFSTSANKARHVKCHFISFRLHKIAKVKDTTVQINPGVRYRYCSRCFKVFSESMYGKNKCKCFRQLFRKKIYICSICEYKSTSPSEHSSHVAGHNIIKKYACKYPLCTASYNARITLKAHIKKKHGSKELLLARKAEFVKKQLMSVSLSENSTKTKQELVNEVPNLNQNSITTQEIKIKEKFQCCVCAKQFFGPYKLANHLKEHKLYMCPICREFSKSKRLDKTHRDSHVGQNPSDCLICWKPILNQKALYYHCKTKEHLRRLKEQQNNNPRPEAEVSTISKKKPSITLKSTNEPEVITLDDDEEISQSVEVIPEAQNKQMPVVDNSKRRVENKSLEIQCHLCFDYMDKKEYFQHLLKFHRQNCYDDNNFFRCEPCSMTFLTYDLWKEHLLGELHLHVVKFLLSQEECASGSFAPHNYRNTIAGIDPLQQPSVNMSNDEIPIPGDINWTATDSADDALKIHLIQHFLDPNAAKTVSEINEENESRENDSGLRIISVESHAQEDESNIRIISVESHAPKQESIDQNVRERITFRQGIKINPSNQEPNISDRAKGSSSQTKNLTEREYTRLTLNNSNLNSCEPARVNNTPGPDIFLPKVANVSTLPNSYFENIVKTHIENGNQVPETKGKYVLMELENPEEIILGINGAEDEEDMEESGFKIIEYSSLANH